MVESAWTAGCTDPGAVKRLGKDPAVVPVAVEAGARIEVAASEDGRERACWPFAAAPGWAPVPKPTCKRQASDARCMATAVTRS